MNLLFRPLSLSVCLFGTAVTFGQTITMTGSEYHGAFHDLSNVLESVARDYDMHLHRSAGDADLYINNIELVPGSNYNPNLGIGVEHGSISYQSTVGPGYGDYTFGTPIQGDRDWDFRAGYQWGAVDSAVPTGIYDFSFNVIGGGDSLATDVLASIPYRLEVAEKLEASVELSFDSPTLAQGGPETWMNVKVTNHMPNNLLALNGSFDSGLSDGHGHYLIQTQIGSSNWDQFLANGESYQTQHSKYKANWSTPAGVYSSTSGVVLGLYDEDRYFISANPAGTIMVVPEPGSMLAIAFGLTALIRRRK
ncbi:MAG: PEP-CTERM sorting domain-containing protein [Armatimonadetes bacterium]|nr:PEP-CTERM sorting domain-containing protein [Armatimonadota bacterium]